MLQVSSVFWIHGGMWFNSSHEFHISEPNVNSSFSNDSDSFLIHHQRVTWLVLASQNKHNFCLSVCYCALYCIFSHLQKMFFYIQSSTKMFTLGTFFMVLASSNQRQSLNGMQRSLKQCFPPTLWWQQFGESPFCFQTLSPNVSVHQQYCWCDWVKENIRSRNSQCQKRWTCVWRQDRKNIPIV